MSQSDFQSPRHEKITNFQRAEALGIRGLRFIDESSCGSHHLNDPGILNEVDNNDVQEMPRHIVQDQVLDIVRKAISRVIRETNNNIAYMRDGTNQSQASTSRDAKALNSRSKFVTFVDDEYTTFPSHHNNQEGSGCKSAESKCFKRSSSAEGNDVIVDQLQAFEEKMASTQKQMEVALTPSAGLTSSGMHELVSLSPSLIYNVEKNLCCEILEEEKNLLSLQLKTSEATLLARDQEISIVRAQMESLREELRACQFQLDGGANEKVSHPHNGLDNISQKSKNDQFELSAGQKLSNLDDSREKRIRVLVDDVVDRTKFLREIEIFASEQVKSVENSYRSVIESLSTKIEFLSESNQLLHVTIESLKQQVAKLCSTNAELEVSVARYAAEKKEWILAKSKLEQAIMLIMKSNKDSTTIDTSENYQSISTKRLTSHARRDLIGMSSMSKSPLSPKPVAPLTAVPNVVTHPNESLPRIIAQNINNEPCSDPKDGKRTGEPASHQSETMRQLRQIRARLQSSLSISGDLREPPSPMKFFSPSFCQSSTASTSKEQLSLKNTYSISADSNLRKSYPLLGEGDSNALMSPTTAKIAISGLSEAELLVWKKLQSRLQT